LTPTPVPPPPSSRRARPACLLWFFCASFCGCPLCSTPPGTESPLPGEPAATQHGAADRGGEDAPGGREDATDVPLASVRCVEPGSGTRVTARWSGMPVPKPFSPAHGFLHLRFQLDDGATLEWKPKEGPGIWACNVFSPGCRHVALPLGGPGGYHIVAVSHLRAYLENREGPQAIARYTEDMAPGGVHAPFVHHHGHWVSATAFELFVSDAGDGDGWGKSGGLRLRAEVGARDAGGSVPLSVVRELLDSPPDDGCAAADVRP
jgi:hypothetical protein